MKHIVLFTIGSYVFTLSALVMLLLGAALYLWLYYTEFKSAKARAKLPLIVLTALLTGTLVGHLFHVLFEKGVFTMLSGYNHIFFGIGMFLSLAFWGIEKKTFFKNISRCAAGFLGFLCLMSFAEEGVSGAGLSRELASSAIHLGYVGLFQGFCLIPLIACEAASRLFPTRFPRDGRALILLLTALYCAFEPFRDSMCRVFLGLRIDALCAMLLCCALLIIVTREKLSESRLSRAVRTALTYAPSAFILLVSPLVPVLFPYLLAAVTVLLYNPLFPYFKPPVRTEKRRKRTFGD